MVKTILIAVIAIGIIVAVLAFRNPTAVAPENGATSSPTAEIINESSSPTPTDGGTIMEQGHVVLYTDNGYTPPMLTIKAGETVTFKNESSRGMWTASAMHPTHAVYGGTNLSEHCPDTSGTSFDQCATSNEYEFTFTKSGTWKYHNHVHLGDYGTIVVQ